MLVHQTVLMSITDILGRGPHRSLGKYNFAKKNVLTLTKSLDVFDISVFALCSPAIVFNGAPKCKERKIAGGKTKSINKLFNSKVSSCPNTGGNNQANKVQVKYKVQEYRMDRYRS